MRTARWARCSRAGRYGNFIHELDWMAGEVLDVLDEQGLAENTLVVLTSDNGGMLNRDGQAAWEAGHRMNGNLLGFQVRRVEGRAPRSVHCALAGEIPAGTTSGALAANVDLVATLAALVGRPLAPGEGPDSVNLLPTLTASSAEASAAAGREQLLTSPAQRKNLTLRKGKWVYISGRPEVFEQMQALLEEATRRPPVPVTAPSR